MISEDDNLPQTGGTENAQPSTNEDNLDDYSYFDPDEDNEELVAEAKPEGETDEADEGQEADESDDEAEPSDDEAKAKPSKVDDTVIVELPTGAKVPLSELKNGYLRQADYTAKTMQIAEEKRQTSQYRQALETESTTLKTIAETFAAYLEQQLPPAPPYELVHTDPARYQAMKVTHDAAQAKLQELIQIGQYAAQTANTVKQTAVAQEVVVREKEALAAQFPEIRNEAGHKRFFDTVFKAAQDFGVSPQELAQITDHRYYAVLKYAAIGKQALEAKAKAQEKVKNVPPVATPTRAARNGGEGLDRERAFQKLQKTGSIDDAVRLLMQS
jgi:hypothetical protein